MSEISPSPNPKQLKTAHLLIIPLIDSFYPVYAVNINMNNLLMGQAPEFGVRQNQTLLLSFAMQQAFRVLQMPIVELEQWLKDEIEQNPALEYEENEEDTAHLSTETEEREIDFESS